MKPTSQVGEQIPTSGAPGCTRQAAAGRYSKHTSKHRWDLWMFTPHE